MNRKLLASALAVCVLSTPVAIAVADETDSKINTATAGPTDVAADHKNETRKNIVAWHRAEARREARREARAERKAKARKRAKKRAKLARQRAAQGQVAAAAAPAPQQSAGGGGGGAAPAHLESIAACESGGNPGAVGGGGAYRGKYQFDQQTWASVGGSGDPAAAPEAEQDARAAELYARTGGAAWPNC